MWSAGRLWQVLLAVAAIAALASLFGPADRWQGVDIGATGASVFFLSLAALITWIAMRPGEVFPDDWSLTERRSWVGTLIAMLILLTCARYLWVLAQLDAVPERIGELPARNLINFIIVLGIAWGICAALLARGAGPVVEDERDLRLRLAADRAGDTALSLALIAGVVSLAGLSAAQLEWWLQPLVLANVLVALLIARSLIENLAMITLYARARR
jgi:hypothetical protein